MREYGTGFVIFGRSRNTVIGYSPVFERLGSVRVRGKFFNYTLINVYAPTEEKGDEEKKRFYDKPVEVYDGAPTRDIKIMLRNFNAKIDRETYYFPTHSLHESSNENGYRAVDFAALRSMIVSSTYFEDKHIDRATWVSPWTHQKAD